MPTLDQVKAQGRQQIHSLAAVSANLVDEDHPDGLLFADDYAGSGLTVRYHNKIDTTGGLNGEYAEIIEGIDRLVFNDANVAEVSQALQDNGQAPLALVAGAVVTIPSYKGLSFKLDTPEPPDGPSETVWVVARKRG